MGSKQKTVIVTGASQGIGAGVVQGFLDRGYNVVANSRNIKKSGAFTESAQLALVDGIRSSRARSAVFPLRGLPPQYRTSEGLDPSVRIVLKQTRLKMPLLRFVL